MNKDFSEFLLSLNEDVKVLVNNIFSKHNYRDVLNCNNENDMKNMVLKFSKSKRDIYFTVYSFKLLGSWFNEHGCPNNINECLDFNKDIAWKEIRYKAPKKFIKYNDFCDAVKDIEMMQENNALYFSCLFRCIYEGIYNDDMTVLSNLKRRDIDLKNGTVKLRPNNSKPYTLSISFSLAEDLYELSTLSYWERNGRYGVVKIRMNGFSEDSVFKIETRSDNLSSENFRNAYYRILRSISNEYLDNKLSPYNLFISGIMYRISLNIPDTLRYYLNDTKRNNSVYKNELSRCNYNNKDFISYAKSIVYEFEE